MAANPSKPKSQKKSPGKHTRKVLAQRGGKRSRSSRRVSVEEAIDIVGDAEMFGTYCKILNISPEDDSITGTELTTILKTHAASAPKTRRHLPEGLLDVPKGSDLEDPQENDDNGNDVELSNSQRLLENIPDPRSGVTDAIEPPSRSAAQRLQEIISQSALSRSGLHDPSTECDALLRRYNAETIPLEELTPSVVAAIADLGRKLEMANEETAVVQEATGRLKKAHALREAHLQELATTDPLTGINNLRGFRHDLQQMMSRRQRVKTLPNYSMVFFDINNFKALNDTYGQIGGNQILIHVASILQKKTRKDIDVIGRIGGDEFVAILYGSSAEAAKRKAAKIAKTVEQTPCQYKGQEISLSLAHGLVPIEKNDTPDDLVERAWRAMRQNKTAIKEKAARSHAAGVRERKGGYSPEEPQR